MALKTVLENTKVPLIVNNRLRYWPIIGYTQENWCELFGSRDLQFRKGDFRFRNKPNWEGACNRVRMTLETFFDKSRNVKDEWFYYDYKDMNKVFHKDGKIFEVFSWGDLDFPDILSEDSTLWIGNAGAHTPCHMDAHGFNLVAQIYGRKLWILISPEEMVKMEPTRVPYEETTIYSGINFFTPGEKFLGLSNIYKVILEPGQVLCVPRHWWHYVENLEPAISINTWIPREEDVESQLDEALVQKFVENFSHTIDKKLINLNESVPDNVLEYLAKKCMEYRAQTKPVKNIMDVTDVSNLVPMSPIDLEQFVREKSQKYNYDYRNYEEEPANTSKMIINSFCQPEMIKIARENFLHQMSNM